MCIRDSLEFANVATYATRDVLGDVEGDPVGSRLGELEGLAVGLVDAFDEVFEAIVGVGRRSHALAGGRRLGLPPSGQLTGHRFHATGQVFPVGLSPHTANLQARLVGLELVLGTVFGGVVEHGLDHPASLFPFLLDLLPVTF